MVMGNARIHYSLFTIAKDKATLLMQDGFIILL